MNNNKNLKNTKTHNIYIYIYIYKRGISNSKKKQNDKILNNKTKIC